MVMYIQRRMRGIPVTPKPQLSPFFQKELSPNKAAEVANRPGEHQTAATQFWTQKGDHRWDSHERFRQLVKADA